MNEVEAYEMELKKREILFDQDGLCKYCGLEINPLESYTLAHLIAKHKWRIQKYGAEVIHHRKNVAATHYGDCNDGVMVNIETLEGKELLISIFEDLGYEIPEDLQERS